MVGQDLEQRVARLEDFRDRLMQEHEALTREMRAAEHKVARLERIVEDMVRRVDQLESDAL
jgi:predicted RNase H-like nuclease (RuvC/YqgF family)